MIVPVGGGGLLAGVALAVKTLRPQTKIIAVEADHVASFSAALQATRPTSIQMEPTLADGLAIPQVGANGFDIARSRVDKTVTVTEEQIALAILRIVELEKGVVEGAGATPLAACLSGKLSQLSGKRIVLVLSGGNIDPNILSRVIESGLVADGRLSRFTAVISRSPGRSRRSDRPNRIHRCEHQTSSTRPCVRRLGCFRGARCLHGGDPQPAAPDRATRAIKRERRANLRFEIAPADHARPA